MDNFGLPLGEHEELAFYSGYNVPSYIFFLETAVFVYSRLGTKRISILWVQRGYLYFGYKEDIYTLGTKRIYILWVQRGYLYFAIKCISY